MKPIATAAMPEAVRKIVEDCRSEWITGASCGTVTESLKELAEAIAIRIEKAYELGTRSRTPEPPSRRQGGPERYHGT